MARTHSTAVDILLQIGRVLVLGIIVGTLASLAAMAFLELVAFLNDQLFISYQSRRKLDDNPVWLLALTILVPTLGGLLVGWLVITIKDQRPHNPSDVIEAIQCQTAESALKVKDSITSVAASIVSLGTGASVGQYGPIVHLGAFLGYRLPFLGKIDPSLSIGCGVAAAIATVFNAPIAGVILAHEVFLRHFSLRAFAPITVASSVGFYLANYVFDREPLFRTAVAPLSNGSEFFAFIGIGIAGAFLAVIFMRLLLWFNQTARRLPIPQMYKPMLAGFVLGLVATQIPDVLGTGGDTLIFALTPGGFEASELAVILTAKIIMTALCIGFGFAGGVFSPALLIGVLYGALVAAGIDWLAPSMHPVLANYAIAGMAAVTSPVIGAPLATILIVFELTRSYELATVVMVSVVFSNIVAYRLFGLSLFDHQLKARGYDLENGREQIILNHQPIVPLIIDDYCRCHGNDSLYDVRSQLITKNHSEAHIVDKQQRYLGSVRLNDILQLEGTMDIRVEKIKFHLNSELIVYTDDMSIGAAMHAMKDFVGESIPVIGTDNQQLLGVVYESTLIQAYLDLAKQLQAERNAAS